MIYSDIEFVELNNLGYKKWCRLYAKRRKKEKGNRKKDYFDTVFNSALIRWEGVLQILLSTISSEQKNRILRYKEQYGFIQYREIDFIAKLTDDSLVLCEIKLKQNYSDNISDSVWKQLNKNLDISSNKYKSVAGLSICVDMSYVYGNGSEVVDQNIYCDFNKIKNYLTLAFSEKNIIWLNSLDVAEFAVEHKLLTNEEVDNMKNIFIQKTNPLSILKADNTSYSNNPFKALKFLKT